MHFREAVQEHPVSNPALGSARELFDAGQYAGVVAVCCQALERQPGAVPLLIQRARAWIALGRNAQAIDDLREVLALDPLCGGAYLALGRLLVNGGQLLAARRAFHGALALDHGDAQAREQLEAVEAALIVEEALALETALVDEPQDAAATRSMRRRLPTQPMGRSATGEVWRAPTLPMSRSAGERNERNDRIERGRARRAELPVGEASERDVSAPRAQTSPMERAVSRALLRRADTAPLTRTTVTLRR